MCVSPNTQYGVISPTKAMNRDGWKVMRARRGGPGRRGNFTTPRAVNQPIQIQTDITISWSL